MDSKEKNVSVKKKNTVTTRPSRKNMVASVSIQVRNTLLSAGAQGCTTSAKGPHVGPEPQAGHKGGGPSIFCCCVPAGEIDNGDSYFDDSCLRWESWSNLISCSISRTISIREISPAGNRQQKYNLVFSPSLLPLQKKTKQKTQFQLFTLKSYVFVFFSFNLWTIFSYTIQLQIKSKENIIKTFYQEKGMQSKKKQHLCSDLQVSKSKLNYKIGNMTPSCKYIQKPPVESMVCLQKNNKNVLTVFQNQTFKRYFTPVYSGIDLFGVECGNVNFVKRIFTWFSE